MDKTLRLISNQLKTREENEFLADNQCYLVLIFSGLWFLYCWWLSEQCYFDFGQYTMIFRWLFCVIHVLIVWKVFQYIIKLVFRFYQFTRRLGILLIDYSSLIALTFLLFVLLTFVLNLKQFLRDIFLIDN
jgi:hypothetical protein